MHACTHIYMRVRVCEWECECAGFSARERVSHLPRGIGANVRVRAGTANLPS